MTERVTEGHGGGGRQMNRLLDDLLDGFDGSAGGVTLHDRDDGGTIPLAEGELVVTTDSHIVDPLSFPGGDIGRLSVAGTVNDLAAMGAEPLALTCALVVEEGLPRETLKDAMDSTREICDKVGVPLLTGDTKVMGRGEVDGLVTNTTGLGVADPVVRDSGLSRGDGIVLTGPVGRHGLAILSEREGFEFDGLESDVAPLWGAAEAALETGGVTAMKDPTRGGLAGALNEMAEKSGVGVRVRGEALPRDAAAESAAELLGMDPLEVANEGVLVIGVREESAEEVLEAVRGTRYGREAEVVGEAVEGQGVVLETGVGGERFVRTPERGPLPRIC